MVLFGACDEPVEVPVSARLSASTTVQVVAPVETTAAPPRASTTALVATTGPSSTTSTTIPDVTGRQYRMFERGGDVLQLQMLVGVRSVDSIYGPVTRAAHVAYLGGPHAALGVFYPDLAEPTVEPSATLRELVDRHFLPADRDWAFRVAFCESSADPADVISTKVSSALAVGWFQHLAKFWLERSEAAGFAGASPFDGDANVAVAAWLLYEGGGPRHWNPSRTCWEAE
jgi:hypothetical protein